MRGRAVFLYRDMGLTFPTPSPCLIHIPVVHSTFPLYWFLLWDNVGSSKRRFSPVRSHSTSLILIIPVHSTFPLYWFLFRDVRSSSDGPLMFPLHLPSPRPCPLYIPALLDPFLGRAKFKKGVTCSHSTSLLYTPHPRPLYIPALLVPFLGRAQFKKVLTHLFPLHLPTPQSSPSNLHSRSIDFIDICSLCMLY